MVSHSVMKKFVFVYFVLLSCFGYSQKGRFHLIDKQTNKSILLKDSLSTVKFLDSLAENNYYFTKIVSVKKVGDTTKILFDKGKNYNESYVQLSDSLSQALKVSPELFTKNLDSIKRLLNKKLVNLGYTFGRVKTRFLGLENDIPKVTLSLYYGKKRTIDGFVLKDYERVPKRFVKNMEKEYLRKNYNEQNLSSIRQSLQNHPFMVLERPPQTLFTKDSTKIFLFLQKKKASTFDGVIGFGNDKTKKLSFNGTLNVNFRNLLNGFEDINIYWQRTPDKSQTFNLKTDIPYLAKTNLGLSVHLNIFRQDSTYANVKFQPALYFHLNNRQKVGLRGNFENSVVTDSLFVQGKDYRKTGFGIWYEMTLPSETALMLYKTKIRAEADFLSAEYPVVDAKAKQNYFYGFVEHNLQLSGNHWLNLKGETALLNSNLPFTTNELLRFGGWNSLRGFNENSLYANFYYYGNAEYRYLIGEQAFFDAFLQYGQLSNTSLNIRPKLYSFGLGFNFFIPIGLMSFQISNGNEFGNPLKFGDTKIHWGILSRF